MSFLDTEDPDAMRASVEAVRVACADIEVGDSQEVAADYLDRYDYETSIRELARRVESCSEEALERMKVGYVRLLAENLTCVARKRCKTKSYNTHWCKPEKVCGRLNHELNLVILDEYTTQHVMIPLNREQKDYLVAVLRMTFAILRDKGVDDFLIRLDSRYFLHIRESFPEVSNVLVKDGSHASLGLIVSALGGYELDEQSEVSRFDLV